MDEFNPDLAKALNRIEDENVRNSIVWAALKNERFIGRRFVKFIVDHVGDDFWNKANRPDIGRVQPESLPDLMKKVYKQRSDTLHKGKPFPAYLFYPPQYGAEINWSLSSSVGAKIWKQADYIPYISFFEELVNYVLKDFLKKNQSKDSSTA